MDTEIAQRMDLLAEDIRSYTLSVEFTDVIIGVWKGYLGGDDGKLEQFKNLVGLVFLKEVVIEQLPAALVGVFGFDEATAREIALKILSEMLYPVRDYFPGVGDMILSLGGTLPAAVPQMFGEQMRKREEGIVAMREEAEAAETVEQSMAIVNDYVETLIEKYPEVGTMVIGAQPSISVKGMDVSMRPMVKYWIQDFMEKTGYYRHSSLDRLQYVCHDKNTRTMNEEERRQLNLILKSADKDITLPYSPQLRKIDFSLVEEE